METRKKLVTIAMNFKRIVHEAKRVAATLPVKSHDRRCRNKAAGAMAKHSEREVKQVKPQPKPRRSTLKTVMKEMKAQPPKKQGHGGAMKTAKPKPSKIASSSSTRQDNATAACVNRQIFQLSRGYAVVSGC